MPRFKIIFIKPCPDNFHLVQALFHLLHSSPANVAAKELTKSVFICLSYQKKWPNAFTDLYHSTNNIRLHHRCQKNTIDINRYDQKKLLTVFRLFEWSGSGPAFRHLFFIAIAVPGTPRSSSRPARPPSTLLLHNKLIVLKIFFVFIVIVVVVYEFIVVVIRQHGLFHSTKRSGGNWRCC